MKSKVMKFKILKNLYIKKLLKMKKKTMLALILDFLKKTMLQDIY